MKNLIQLVSLFLIFGWLQAQETVLPFTNQSLINLNPSFAGSNGLLRVQSFYRIQAPTISSYNHTLNNSVDAYIKPIHGAIAVNYQSQNISNGYAKTQQLSIAYAQHFLLFNKTLKVVPSLKYTYGENRMQVNDDIIFGPSQFYTETKSFRAYHTLGTGILFNYKNLYVGAVLSNLNRPVSNLYTSDRSPSSLRLHASYSKSLGAKALVQFSGSYYKQSEFMTILVNTNVVLFKHLLLGAGITANDAFLANVGYRNDFISATVAYDISFSKLAGNNYESWSAAFSFNLRNPQLRRTLTNFENW
jgi:Type IX secretion system membrane protein PorP/SprF